MIYRDPSFQYHRQYSMCLHAPYKRINTKWLLWRFVEAFELCLANFLLSFFCSVDDFQIRTTH
jgi:hypothetical protein